MLLLRVEGATRGVLGMPQLKRQVVAVYRGGRIQRLIVSIGWVANDTPDLKHRLDVLMAVSQQNVKAGWH